MGAFIRVLQVLNLRLLLTKTMRMLNHAQQQIVRDTGHKMIRMTSNPDSDDWLNNVGDVPDLIVLLLQKVFPMCLAEVFMPSKLLK
jgi:hypothetical protein